MRNESYFTSRRRERAQAATTDSNSAGMNFLLEVPGQIDTAV